MKERIEVKNCKECLHFEACSKWTDFPEQLGFPVCRKYRKQSVGEWAVTGTERAWNNAEYPIERTCSVCGMRRNIETQVGWNFCPNCGAKMKGEGDEG